MGLSLSSGGIRRLDGLQGGENGSEKGKLVWQKEEKVLKSLDADWLVSHFHSLLFANVAHFFLTTFVSRFLVFGCLWKAGSGGIRCSTAT